MNIWQLNRGDENLQGYIEQELDSLREYLKGYERLHPEAAVKLGISGGLPTDTDMALLVQGMAFLTARLNRRLDDGYGELCRQLLNIMAQELLAPLPAAGIARFTVLKNKTVTCIEKGTRFTVECEGRQHDCVCPVSLNIPPWQIDAIELNRGPFPSDDMINPVAGAGMHLQLSPTEPGLLPVVSELKNLLFYLPSYAAQADELFDLICGHLTSVVISCGGMLYELEPECISLPAFADDWWILPEKSLMFPGLRQMQEFFAYPDSFRFINLSLESVWSKLNRCGLDIWLLFDDAAISLMKAVGPQHMSLGCVPLINIFPARLGPARLDHETLLMPLKPGPVYPDSRVYRVCEVTDISKGDAPQAVPHFQRINGLAEKLGWMMVRKEQRDTLLFTDTRSRREQSSATLLVIDVLSYDSHATEFTPDAPVECLSDVAPGAKLALLGRGYPVRMVSPSSQLPPLGADVCADA